MKTYRSILLVKVDCFDLINFKSSEQKSNFLSSSVVGTYELSPDGNYAKIYKYMSIDPYDGFVLHQSPLTYCNCVSLIDLYL